MPLRTSCPSCGQQLAVPESQAGRLVRCPKCQQSLSVPAGPSPAANPGSSAGGSWQVRTPDAQVYGPVTRTELDAWVSEGRLDDRCSVRIIGTENWRPAAELYPHLKPASSAGQPFPPGSPSSYPSARGIPSTPTSWPGPAPAASAYGGIDPANPYASAGVHAPGPMPIGPYGGVRAHRGQTVLTLGILAVAMDVTSYLVGCCCWPLSFLPMTAGVVMGIIAWVMGHADLAAMKRREMDDRGRSNTQAGMVMGVVAVALTALSIIGVIVMFALGISLQGLQVFQEMNQAPGF